MENDRNNLHALKLADLREQLREAQRAFQSLKEKEKEWDKEKQELQGRDVSKVFFLNIFIFYFFNFLIF